MEFSVSNEKVMNHRFIVATIPDAVIFRVVEDMLPEVISRYLASDYAKKYGEKDFKKVDLKRVKELAEEKLAERIVQLEIEGAHEAVRRLEQRRSEQLELKQKEFDVEYSREKVAELLKKGMK